MRKRALNKDDKSPKADRWRTKVRQGRLSTIRNRNITTFERIRRIPTLLTASQHISILRSWRFYNTLAVQNACSCVFSPVLICLSVVPRKSSTKRKRALPVVSSSKQEFVFSRTCAGKRHLKSRERGDERGVHGGENGLSVSDYPLSSRHSPKRGLTGENARANAVSRRALSPVKIKFPVASADMRRHSDDENEVYGEKTTERASCEVRLLSSRPSSLSSRLNFVPRSPRKSSTKRKRALPVVSSSKQEFVFSRTCAGKRHLRSRERGDRKGANGGKREGERSERESVVTRLNLSLRFFS